jgi:ferredoxin
MTVLVSVDNDRCHGHARCWQIVAQVFTLDDEGYSNIGKDKPVPPELETLARSAVAACPEGALSITEDR